MHDVVRQPLALTAAAMILVCANTALANPGFSEKFFNRLDLNGSGVVQRAEANRWFMRLFHSVDANGDQALALKNRRRTSTFP
jgi:hypothetical protein